jgi:cell division protein FtsB
MQSTQAQQTARADRRRKVTRIESKASKMLSDHHSRIRDLQKSHSILLGQMHGEFESTLIGIELWAEKLSVEKIAPVADQIRRTQKALSDLKSSPVSESVPTVEETVEIDQRHRLDRERIRMLEVALRDKNRDRLSSLLGMKRQLGNCVAVLEDLDQAHAVAVDKLQQRLEMVDERYDRKIGWETEKHQREIAAMRGRIASVERQIAKAEDDVKKCQDGHSDVMLEMAQSTEEIRMELHRITAKDPPSRKAISASLVTQVKLEDMKVELGKREKALETERGNNAALKREIARLRTNATIAERRSALSTS